MPYLISYDIENDALRLKVANRLLAAGCIRLQMSVFADPIPDTPYKELFKWLQQIAWAKDDSLFILNIGPDTLKKTLWLGKQVEDWPIIADPPDVLFI